jgi:hypothetical protein
MSNKSNIVNLMVQCGEINLNLFDDVTSSAEYIVPNCRIFSPIPHTLKAWTVPPENLFYVSLRNKAGSIINVTILINL